MCTNVVQGLFFDQTTTIQYSNRIDLEYNIIYILVCIKIIIMHK